MSDKIRHSGIVNGIEEGCVKVRILQHSACSACKVSAHCHASETAEKIVEVAADDATDYKVGDHVTVVADSATGFRASLYAYLLPLLLMVVTLVIVLSVVQVEWVAALSSLGVLVPYYLLLYLLRDKMKSRLTFMLEM